MKRDWEDADGAAMRRILVNAAQNMRRMVGFAAQQPTNWLA
jgi:hypothetical protein